MKLKWKMAIVLIICSLFAIYSGYKRYEYYSSLPEETELHSIVLKGCNNRIELNREEIVDMLNMMHVLEYGGTDGSTRYGLTDSNFISCFINSNDVSITPHILLNLYVEDNIYKGSADIENNNFEVLECDELHDWAINKLTQGGKQNNLE